MTTPANTQRLTGRSRITPLAVLLAGTFMIVLDFFIVNVMLPSMQADLHASTAGIEWVVAGYGLPFAVCLIAAGRLGDRFGRRRTFTYGLTVFTATSALCAAAWSPTVLILARAAQGVGAALMSPNVLSIIGVLYTGADRVRALRSWGLVMGLAAVAAQLVGGVLVGADIASLSWRACFLVNIPVGLAALVLVRGSVPESAGERKQELDTPGMFLITVALLALVLPLIEGREHGWPLWTWASLACVPVLLALFAAHERALSNRDGAPLLDLHLLRQRTFAAGLLTQAAFWCGQASFFLILALYLQDGMGLSALDAGAVFAILATAYLAASLRAPALTPRLGRDLVAGGALVLMAGYALLIAAVWSGGMRGSVALLAPGLLLVGAGQGLSITPLASIVMSRLDPRRAGAASGSLSTMQQLGNTIGVAITGAVFFAAMHGGYARAFELSVAQLAGIAALVALLSRLLPGTASSASPEFAPRSTSPGLTGSASTH